MYIEISNNEYIYTYKRFEHLYVSRFNQSKIYFTLKGDITFIDVGIKRSKNLYYRQSELKGNTSSSPIV